MNTKIYLIPVLALLLSCVSKNEFEELENINDSLRNEIQSLKNTISDQELDLKNSESTIAYLNTDLKKQTQTKFVWTVIEHKRGRYIVSLTGGNTGFEGPIENYIYYSEVNQVEEFNENKEYLLQDQLEKSLRQKFGHTVHSIQNRQTFVFDTYKEASEHRYSFINK